MLFPPPLCLKNNANKEKKYEFCLIFFLTTCVWIKISTNFRMPFKGRHLRLSQIKQIIQHTNTNCATHWRYTFRMFFCVFSFSYGISFGKNQKELLFSCLFFSNLYVFIFNTTLPKTWWLSGNMYCACGKAFRIIVLPFLIL